VPNKEKNVMGTVIHVDDSKFQETINNSTTPVLVDFYAEWCPPCKRLGPTLEALAKELDGRLTIVKVNVDASAIPAQFGVMNIPTMVLFKNGEEVLRIVGNKSRRALLHQLEPYLD